MKKNKALHNDKVNIDERKYLKTTSEAVDRKLIVNPLFFLVIIVYIFSR